MKNKYFVGSYKDFKETRGWFVGSFLDDSHPCKTNDIEVLYREHKKGDADDYHCHEFKIELVLVVKGRIKFIIDSKEFFLSKGDFLYLDKGVFVSSEFLEDSQIFVVHSPSVINDKKVIK